jgi:methylated-DNA-[protein]-cysteine S-methyltransferase
LLYTQLSSPVGDLLLLSADATRVCGLYFQGGPTALAVQKHWTKSDQPFGTVVAQLGEYFEGRRTEFTIPLSPQGTPFQLAVWQALRRIPYGQTRSYAEIAREIGRPTACRAVGAANGRNPISIIVPCHRVIGTDGSLTGFGGGLQTKRLLLELESTATADSMMTSRRQRRTRDLDRLVICFSREPLLC